MFLFKIVQINCGVSIFFRKALKDDFEVYPVEIIHPHMVRTLLQRSPMT